MLKTDEKWRFYGFLMQNHRNLAMKGVSEYS